MQLAYKQNLVAQTTSESLEQKKQDKNRQGIVDSPRSATSKASQSGIDFLRRIRIGPRGISGGKDIINDQHYVLKVIDLPLLEQTRLTRISRRIEDARDKTEFWIPALPWRAIDCLNYRGIDMIGLYSASGSNVEIKKRQRRFDEGIIASVLKAWFRDLPDEIFLLATQEKIARECID